MNDEAQPLKHFNTESAATVLDLRGSDEVVRFDHVFTAMALREELHAIGLGSNKLSYERAARLAFAVVFCLAWAWRLKFAGQGARESRAQC